MLCLEFGVPPGAGVIIIKPVDPVLALKPLISVVLLRASSVLLCLSLMMRIRQRGLCGIRLAPSVSLRLVLLFSHAVVLKAFQSCCGSEKQILAATDLEDILIAFEKLDEGGNIPEIFCEATDLVKLPTVVADACTELVQHNSSSLEAITGKLEYLSLELSSLLPRSITGALLVRHCLLL